MNYYSMIFLTTGFMSLFLTIVIFVVYKDKQNNLLRYSHTTGVITDSAINGFNYNHGMNKNAILGYGNGHYSMRHRIYEYEVNGKKYSRAEDAAVTISVANQDLGKTVDVYYDEKNPKKSIIVVPGRDDGLKVLSIVFFSLSSFLIMIGLFLLIL